MKLKLGTYEIDIKAYDSMIGLNYDTNIETERLDISLLFTSPSVSEINAAIKEHFDGTVVIVRSNGVEETYSGFSLNGVRKYGEMSGDGDRLSIVFTKE